MKYLSPSLQRLHSIGSLGNVKATKGDIRAERLEKRVQPKVPFPHKHDFFQLVFVFSGRGYHAVDFTNHAVKDHQVYILRPGQVHGWELSPQTKGAIVEFTVETISGDPEMSSLEMLSTLRSLPDVMMLSARTYKRVSTILETMIEETASPNLKSKTFLRSYLNVLLIELFRIQKQTVKSKNPHSDLEIRFVELVEQEYKLHKNIDYYAQTLGVSSRHLARAVHRAFSQSPKVILQARCLLEAKRLLAYSTLTIAQVGYELGYEDANYFSRFFMNHAEEAAQAFRERFRKN